MENQFGNIGLLSYAAVIAMLSIAAVVDIKEHRIPDVLILAGTATGLIFSLLDPRKGVLSSFMGGMTVGLILLVIHCITKGGLGLGDVKLFGCTGIYLGLEHTASAIVIASILSGLYSLVLVAINSENKKREIPFAPFILAGVLAAIVF